MPTIINNRSQLTTDPIRNFRFLVTFKPHDREGSSSWYSEDVTLGFTSVSGLSVTTDSIPYREGGYNTTVHQIPGQTTFAPITLQRGVILNTKQNWEWMRTLFSTVQGGAKNVQGKSFRADLEIAVLSHPIPGSAGGNDATGDAALNVNAADDHVSMRFNVYNCWITSVSYSDLNAGDNAIFVEQATLVHEGFDVNWATSLEETGSAPEFD
jgi:phage tail-like protein